MYILKQYNIFHHLKLEIVLAIPASNDEKYNLNNSAEQGLTLNPLSPHDALNHHFTDRLNFPTNKGFRTKISMKLVYQYMVTLSNF